MRKEIYPMKWVLRFIRKAEHISQWSKDPSTKCGAIIVRPDLSTASEGFNGFPKGFDDSPELYEDIELKHSAILHAEMNALIQASESVKGCAVFTWPVFPCDRCAVHLIQAGITHVYSPLTVCTPNMDEKIYQRARRHFNQGKVYFTELAL